LNPLYIKAHELDGVAIVANPDGLGSGAEFGCGLKLTEPIPQSHKVALRDLAVGEAIVRYGHVIGHANRDMNRGSWVREEFIDQAPAPSLDDLPIATAIPPAQSPLEGYTFEGYTNADGTVGTRNLLGITTTVQCVAPTVEHAVKRIRDEILPRFTGVDGVTAITHSYGCGVAIDAPAAEVPIRTLRNISHNPNLCDQPLVVSLGCEKLQPNRMFPMADSVPYTIRLQDEELVGFGDIVAAILKAAEIRLEQLAKRRRVTRPAADLVVGVQCGGSDAFSGVTSNRAIGYAADLLVRAGASVSFSEVTEVRDAVHLLTPRAVNAEVGRALIREMAWYDDYLAHGLVDRSANPTPGNKLGGLANVIEKALGSVAKSGSSPLADVISHGERIRSKGLTFAATPANDFVCGTLQLAAGMNVHLFSTGRGTPYGLAHAPVVKISSRTSLAERWPDLIDIDAGSIATGGASVEDVGWELFHRILDVASGTNRTWTERWGLHNDLALFNPGPLT
jgi:galactarate dehydratase